MKYRIAHDPPSNKVASPLLQVQLGCEDGVAHRFRQDTWMLDYAETMIVEELDEIQLQQLIEQMEANRPLIEALTKEP